jgi:hypothetical protein
MAHTTEHIAHNGSGHEHREASPRLIVETVIGLVISVVIVCAIVFGVFTIFKVQTRNEDRVSAMSGPNQLPPGPHLEVHPAEELKALRTHEDEVLNSYRWVDKASGTVHITIDKAMDEVVNQLPMRPQSQAQAQGGTRAKPH